MFLRLLTLIISGTFLLCVPEVSKFEEDPVEAPIPEIEISLVFSEDTMSIYDSIFADIEISSNILCTLHIPCDSIGRYYLYSDSVLSLRPVVYAGAETGKKNFLISCVDENGDSLTDSSEYYVCLDKPECMPAESLEVLENNSFTISVPGRDRYGDVLSYKILNIDTAFFESDSCSLLNASGIFFMKALIFGERIISAVVSDDDGIFSDTAEIKIKVLAKDNSIEIIAEADSVYEEDLEITFNIKGPLSGRKMLLKNSADTVYYGDASESKIMVPLIRDSINVLRTYILCNSEIISDDKMDIFCMPRENPELIISHPETLSIYDSLCVNFSYDALEDYDLKITLESDSSVSAIFAQKQGAFRGVLCSEEKNSSVLCSLFRNDTLVTEKHSLVYVCTDKPLLSSIPDSLFVNEGDSISFEFDCKDIYGEIVQVFAYAKDTGIVSVYETEKISTGKYSLFSEVLKYGFSEIAIIVLDDDGGYSDTGIVYVCASASLPECRILYPEKNSFFEDTIITFSINLLTDTLYSSELCIFNRKNEIILQNSISDSIKAYFDYDGGYTAVLMIMRDDSVFCSDSVYFSTGKEPMIPPSIPVFITDTLFSDTIYNIVSWSASEDPNGDSLSYILRIKNSDDPGYAEYIVNDTFCTFDNQIRDGLYSVSVAAVDETGLRSGFSENMYIKISPKPDLPPFIPENIEHTVRPNEILITFTKDAEEDIAGYYLFIKNEGDSTFNSSGSISEDEEKSFHLYASGYAEHAVMTYYISVSDSAGNITNSAEQNLTVADRNPPIPQLNYGNISDSSIDLSWDYAEIPDFNSFCLYVFSDDYEDLYCTYSQQIKSYTFSSLRENQIYKIFGEIKDSAGNRNYSDTLELTTAAYAPPGIFLNSINEDSTGITVVFEQSLIDDWKSYVLCINHSAVPLLSDSFAVKNTSIEDNSFFISSDDYAEKDSFSIRVFVCDSTGLYSGSNTSVVNALDRRPVKRNLSMVSISDTAAQISWEKSDENDFSCYRIFFRYAIPHFEDSLLAEITDIDSNFYKIENLEQNTAFSLMLIVADSSGLVSDTSVLDTVSLNRPPTPGLLSFTEDFTFVTINWNENNDNDFSAYEIIRSYSSYGAPDDSVVFTSASNLAGEITLSINLGARERYYMLKTYDSYGEASESNLIHIGTRKPNFMKFIPSGSFIFGNAEDTSETRTVSISGFYMDSTEFTKEEYYSLFNAHSFNPTYTLYSSDEAADSAAFPVVLINFYKAVYCCNVRSKKYGLDTAYSFSSLSGTPPHITSIADLECDFSAIAFRLPTEAEWEYAAHGALTGNCYWSGNDDPTLQADLYCWSNRNTPYPGIIHAGASKLPNNYGLYDMFGNVSEWVWDYSGSYSYEYPVTDPRGAEFPFENIGGGGTLSKGGSVYYCNFYIHRNSTEYRSADQDYLGFRMVVPEVE